MSYSVLADCKAASLAMCAALAMAGGLFAPPPLAHAQGARPDCVLDRCGDRNDRRNYRARDRFRDNDRSRRRDRNTSNRGGGRDYGSAPGRFDFYVLALSWSPSYCASEAGRRSRFQCRIGARNAFVVHGLWPQNQRGAPSYCDQRNPPRNVVESQGRVFPEFGLARYQWRKHGSCSGLSPSAYFTTVQKARDKVIIPPSMQNINSPAKADPDAIEKAFLAVNKDIRPDNIAVTCKNGDLQEVRICMSRDLRNYVSCPEVDRRSCRAASVSIPPPR